MLAAMYESHKYTHQKGRTNSFMSQCMPHFLLIYWPHVPMVPIRHKSTTTSTDTACISEIQIIYWRVLAYYSNLAVPLATWPPHSPAGAGRRLWPCSGHMLWLCARVQSASEAEANFEIAFNHVSSIFTNCIPVSSPFDRCNGFPLASPAVIKIFAFQFWQARFPLNFAADCCLFCCCCCCCCCSEGSIS